MDGVIRFNAYSQEGIRFLTQGTSCFIGIVDETTVLKYPIAKGDKATLALLGIEARMYQAIGPHKYIIGFKGQRKDGLLLDRARIGSIAEYLKNNKPTEQQRLEWARQATEAIATVHKKMVLHRDINVNNFLLDEELNIKLCDFQGHLLGPNGKLKEDGSAAENVKSFMPRANLFHADWKTGIFSLGSAFYYIMEGQEPFPELDSFVTKRK